jgi:hypothetical protein
VTSKTYVTWYTFWLSLSLLSRPVREKPRSILLTYSLLNLISGLFKPLLYRLCYVFNVSATPLFFPGYFLFFRCLSDSQQPSMEPRYFCTICLQRPAPLFFLKDASSLPSSKVFATCYPCREKVKMRYNRKRSALQEIDPNIGPPPAQRRATSISRVLFRPTTINQGSIPPVNPPTSLAQSLQPTPVGPPPIPPVQPPTSLVRPLRPPPKQPPLPV